MQTFIILTLITIVSTFISLFFLFEKAGENKWLALIPVYNLVIWTKTIERPWWWVLIMIFPGVNILMYIVFVYNTGTVFDRQTSLDRLLQAFIPFVGLLKISFDKDAKYVGQPEVKTKNIVKEWLDALVFAVIAASIIRGYFLEAFTIPTSSMEKDLLIGDYLFVSKMHYGAKIPKTPISLPFTHNNLPTSYIPSYIKSVQLPDWRLPKFQDIKRFDRVVFNFPTGDTAILSQSERGDELQGHNYYQIVRDQAYQLFTIEKRKTPGSLTLAENEQYISNRAKYENMARQSLLERNTYYYWDNRYNKYQQIKTSGYAVRPIDKKENYIKRCVALPGDVLEFKNGILHINGKKEEVENTQHLYLTVFNRDLSNKDKYDIKKKFNLSPADINKVNASAPYYYVNASDNKFKKLKEYCSASNSDENRGISILQSEKIEYKKDSITSPRLEIYPNHPSFNWTQDNFGPLWMPKAGETIQLNDSTYHLYKRCIRNYEGNTLTVKEGKYIINGKETTSYTFKQGYYYLVGDNRHNSADSRFWGFVPADHVVGKAIFIWMSLDQDLDWFDGKIRWNRFFTIVHNN